MGAGSMFDTILRGLFSLLCGAPEPRPKPTEDNPLDVYVPPEVTHHPNAAASHQQSYQTQTEEYQPPQYQQPSSHPQPYSPPAHQPPHQQHAGPGPRVDLNQVNQHNEHYTSLRSRANQEGDQMAQCFEQSHEAYNSGDGALAKELSNKGKAHQREMERLNKEASDWIFIENNKDSQPGEVDLHGLYVKEAITYTDRAIQEARSRGDTELHLIVGKGLHSSGHVAKLKPAIEELMQKNQLVAELDPQNSGVLIVSLDGHTRGTGRDMQPDDITRSLDNKDEQCVIM